MCPIGTREQNLDKNTKEALKQGYIHSYTSLTSTEFFIVDNNVYADNQED